MIIAPSLLAADWSNLREELRSCEHFQIEYIHFDVMDGHFVPPITFGEKLVADMRLHSKAFFDVHLMVERPMDHFASIINAGADAVTFHIEAQDFSYRCIHMIRSLRNDIKVGIAVNPHTPISMVNEMLPHVDIVLIMSVEPGFGGQSFIPGVLSKITYLQDYRQTHKTNFLISVDGGVNKDNALSLLQHGVDILVMGSAFFGAKDRKTLVTEIRGMGETGR